MNYYQNRRSVTIGFEDYNYVMSNWKEEKELIDRWCSLVGLGQDEYKIIIQPQCSPAIIVKFSRPLYLDPELEE